ncbi:MAG: M23 family metallopeptidase [Candidatus Kaiserbacteria bacterium]|nr:M23 family metallopeptidase [Candidatus Kaiserbacteria bacterium]
MYRPTASPCFPIKSYQQIFIPGFAILAFTAILLPNRADAFWPFSTNADAAVNATIPSSLTPTLQATLNSNPDVRAPIALTTSGDSALISHSGPTGTVSDTVNTPPPDRISVYVVRPGDTLSDIADMFGVSVNTIIWANNLTSVKDVHPGDTLIILPVSGTERTIVKGDTLNSLAKKYNADANEIAQYNGLDPSAPLALGSTIIIPGGEISAPASSARSPASSPTSSGGGSIQTGYYSNPVPGGVITQGVHGKNAVDIAAARGTPIHAAANGTVIIVRNNGGWNGGYGNYVVITHANGTQTLYAHMTHAIVSAGQSVSSGQIIGYVGSTGESTGPHLHFEVRSASNPFRNCRVGSVCSPK